MNSLSFFFSDILNKERLSWVLAACNGRVMPAFFFAGNAALAWMHDNRLQELATRSIQASTDQDGQSSSRQFWTDVIRSFSPVFPVNEAIDGSPRFGFLLLDGPYQSHAAVHAMSALNRARDANLVPDLFMYLDGVHAAHAFQRPTTFMNIADAIQRLVRSTGDARPRSQLLACSRCATARGYASVPFDENNTKSSHAIPEVDFVNLNNIIEHFQSPWGILSTGCAIARREAVAGTNQKVALNILACHPPYGTEHAYGAISMAMAAAMNHDMPTNLIFIEDGVLCVSGLYRNGVEDQLYNIQEIIESAQDESLLRVIACKQSMDLRGLCPMKSLGHVAEISLDMLGGLLLQGSASATITRTFIF